MFGATFWIAVALATWDEHRQNGFPPRPQKFLWIVVIWSVLGLVALTGASDIAAVFGFGVLLAMAYTYLGADSGKPPISDSLRLGFLNKKNPADIGVNRRS